MPYVKIPGLVGKVYVPETPRGSPKKHPCKDCFHCQMCGESRCHVCRGEKESRDCEAFRKSGKESS